MIRPMVDDLALPQVQQIVTQDRRRLVEHRAPGMDGSLLQNLGRDAAWVVLQGVATGPDAAPFIASLSEKLRTAAPVAFVADIVADAHIERMVIDDLRVEDIAGAPARLTYTLSLREHPAPPPTVATSLDPAILGEAADLVSGLVDGLAGATAFAAALADITGTLGDLLQKLQRFREAVERSRP
jgi:hypothetical protein